MRQFLRFLLLIGVWGSLGKAQAQRLDPALASQPLSTRPDTSRVLGLNELCWQWSVRDASRAVQYGQQGLQLARRLHFARGELACMGSLAKAAVRQDDDITASHYFQQIIRYPGPEPWVRAEKLTALLGLCDIAARQEQYAVGVQYCRDALDQHYTSSLTDMAMVQNCLAVLYGYWLKSGRAVPDSAARLEERYARLAVATCRRSASSLRLAACLNGMGLVHQRLDRLDSAAYCQQEAQQLYHRLGNRFHEMETQLLVAEIRAAQHRWPEVVRLLPAVIGWAKQVHAARQEAYGYHLLAQARAATGQSAEAYRLAGLELALLDTIQSAKRREALARLQVQFDTERQRNRVRELTHRSQVQNLKAQKQRLYLFLLGGLLVAVAAGLLVAGLLARRLRRSQQLLTRQNTEMAATRAEQDRLYALVAHDLRSPVEAFMGLARLLSRYVERKDTERLMGLGARVQEAAEGLRALLDNLLSWALNQRGELTPQLESLAVANLLTQLTELYQPSAEAAGVALVIEPEATGYVYADANMTRTILRNLLSNALRATPEGGQIVLSATSVPGNMGEQAAVTISLRDTGEGIPPEDAQRLLAAGPHASASRGAAGLGLRLSQAFALTQHGRLTLTSVVGYGTTVCLTLPAAYPPVEAQLVPKALA